MSYYDDYVAEGLCCESCGGLLDGSEPGFSRLCDGCRSQPCDVCSEPVCRLCGSHMSDGQCECNPGVDAEADDFEPF